MHFLGFAFGLLRALWLSTAAAGAVEPPPFMTWNYPPKDLLPLLTDASTRMALRQVAGAQDPLK